MKMLVRKPSEEEIKSTLNWGTWTKGPSEFPWTYDEKETCYILDGEATVSSKDGEITFSKGDWVIFETGLECVWHIKKTIRKKYMFG
jgi:hypothetical protein